MSECRVKSQILYVIFGEKYRNFLYHLWVGCWIIRSSFNPTAYLSNSIKEELLFDVLVTYSFKTKCKNLPLIILNVKLFLNPCDIHVNTNCIELDDEIVLK